MIFILASTYASAKRWATAQQLADNEWFSTLDLDDLKSRENFHVVILDSASELSPVYFEKLLHMAQIRGRMNRK